MRKPAPAAHPVHELIRERWSPRAFSSRRVEVEKLLGLFEAARWAPSSYNEQPWRFIVGDSRDEGAHQQLLSCLVEVNQEWASKAPVLVLTVAKLRFDRNGAGNRHAFHDVGMAVENLTLQATALGLFVHHMAGFHVERARELASIPEGYEPVAMMALGYPGNADELPEKLRQRELADRQRLPLEAIVFSGSWGQPVRWPEQSG